MLDHVILGIIFPSLPSIDTRITRETAHKVFTAGNS